MLRLGDLNFPFRAAALFLLICGAALFTSAGAGIVHAQLSAPVPTTEETSQGIQQYKKGDTREAITLLTAAVKKNRADGPAWYYLGLARVKEDNLKEARKAFETAVSLLPDFAPAHSSLAYTLMLLGKSSDAEREANAAIKLNTQDANAHYVLGTAHLLNHQTSAALEEAAAAIKAQPSLAVAYLLKSQSFLTAYSDAVASSSKVIRAPRDTAPTERERQEIRARDEHQTELMRSAVEALTTYLKLAPPGPETEGWQYQLKTMRVYAGVNRRKDAASSTPSESSGSGVLSRAVILNKPEPVYTLAARRAGVRGTVLLRAIFSARGTVDDILVLRSLPYGLTEETIAAARRIKFKPATRNGQPVSMFQQLEYHFEIY